MTDGAKGMNHEVWENRLVQGDSSVWVNLAPEYIEPEEITSAWEEPLKRRGEPGYPNEIHFYTHFPYCKNSCSFCMYWHKVPDDDDKYRVYSEYLIERLRQFRTRFGRTTISNAYFGGGTPTAMPLRFLKNYLDAVLLSFDIQYEFTVEAHPEALSAELLQILHAAGVNRLSMGIQSTNKTVLKNITRRNGSYDDISSFVKAAMEKGIVTNLDLCIGLPNQTRDIIAQDLTTLTAMNPSRITLYPYHSVKNLPHTASPNLSLNQLITDTSGGSTRSKPLDSIVIDGGYENVEVNQFRGTLEKKLATPSVKPQKYVCFSSDPGHLIGLGPASYSHIYGHSWFREVGSLNNLDPHNPVFSGTRITREEETLLTLLAKLSRNQVVDTSVIYQSTGVDPWKTYPTQFSEGLDHGILLDLESSETKSDLRLNPDKPHNETTDYLRTFIPKYIWKKKCSKLPGKANVELQLLGATRNPQSDSTHEALSQWRGLMKIPLGGRKFRGVWVTQVDDVSIYFGIEGRNNPPLRVFIAPRGVRQGYAESSKFVISHHNKPLTEKEATFFHKLVEHTLKVDPPGLIQTER